jgi:exodeoxyribonuclease V alpha subunit
MEILVGSVERITYYNPETNYCVLRLRPDKMNLPGANREGLVTVVGNLPELSPGEYLRLRGRWDTHPKHGVQFQVEVCEQSLPATVTGIRRYLGSGMIKGIGPRLAERIVAHFGAQTLDIIENHPERLREAPDIGPKRTRQIIAAWEDQKQVKEIMLFLHSHGVSTNLAVKIYKQYGDQSLAVVQSDPYRMTGDIFGVGFKTADRIAQALGLPSDHPSRIEAGVIHILNEMSTEGHIYVPQQELVEAAAKLLEVAPELVTPAIERLQQGSRLQCEVLPQPVSQEAAVAPPAKTVREQRADYTQPAVYLTPYYYGEVGVAERLAQLVYTVRNGTTLSRLSDIPPLFIPLDETLSPEQQAAVKTCLAHPVSVLTGGPGTGKTTTVRALIAVLESAKKRYALASPTGRAAKRLSEAAGRPASTIHRLLGYSPKEGFKHNQDNPLPVDMLVVDEASMLDLLLANHLLKALEPGSHLLLVGDVDQLPSVGAGDVLRDIIASDIAPLTRLSIIFRQAADSLIITNAHHINQGKMPIFAQVAEATDRDSKPGDFFLFPAESAEQAADWVQRLVCERIPRKFGFNPKNDIQVLAPMYRGPAGVHALNQRLQEVLNPASPRKAEKALFGQVFRTGDKVMQTQNDYEKDVYNGEIGSVVGLDIVEQTLSVDFDGRQVTYDWSETDQLVQAYAISVHKSQGGEFPVIVMPILTQHFMMLQRNLLYTAVTRAKNLVVLVGNKRAIAIAIKNNKVAQRYSALDWRLRQRA